jgi:hypothetical protein
MSQSKTLDHIFNAIFSPELESGATPSDSPDGPMTDLFGQVVALASLSLAPALVAAPPTTATSGPTGSISSASAALQSSLESKLKQRLTTAGSTWFKLTWKAKITPAGRSVCLLRASALPTTGSACGSWLTPNANEDAAGSLRGNMQKMLTHQAKERDPEGCAAGMQLNANLARWLMGIPVDWHTCAPTATPSSRKSRKRS